jgi:RNA polymerase sigma factor (sigma-70 family)
MATMEFNELVLKGSKSLHYPALKFTSHNKEDASDLIQDTLLKAFKNEDKFVKGSNIKAWLFIIMRNTYISKYNKNKRNNFVNTMDEEHIFTSNGATENNKGAANIALSEMNAEIDKLDKNYKDPFMLHFSGFKYEEIAEKLKIPMGTVKNRIHVARKVLMENLQAYKN